jgi:hypothetical protein
MSDKHYVHAPETTKLEELLTHSKPWFERYATALIYGAAAVIALIAIVVWYYRQPKPGSQSTQELMLARTAEEFRDVADSYPGTEIAIRARLRQADMMLATAFDSLYSNREVGVEELESAEAAYENLENRSDLPSDVRQRVLVGLARVTEARCDGSDKTVDAAVAAWQRVLDEYPDSEVFKSLAEDRIDQLPRESSRSFYAWFQAQNPKPGDDLTLPQDRPATDVPELPDFSEGMGLDINSLLTPDPSTAAPSQDTTLPAEGTTSEDPAATPEAGAAKPDGDAPAEEKTAAPASATPAAGAPESGGGEQAESATPPKPESADGKESDE